MVLTITKFRNISVYLKVLIHTILNNKLLSLRPILAKKKGKRRIRKVNSE